LNVYKCVNYMLGCVYSKKYKSVLKNSKLGFFIAKTVKFGFYNKNAKFGFFYYENRKIWVLYSRISK
jgi:hypothetical protein